MPHAASHAEVHTPAFGPARSAPAGKKIGAAPRGRHAPSSMDAPQA
jgi:hypothetical protein